MTVSDITILGPIENSADHAGLTDRSGENRGKPTPETPPSPLKTVQRLLRGRYRFAIPLASLGLLVGGLVGYLAWRPVYESTSMIQVDPLIRGLAVNDERLMPAYDGFIGSQVETVRSERIVGMAMSSPTWRAATAELSSSDVPDFQTFSENLTATRPKGSQIIVIGYEAADPQTARAAVVAVEEAFTKVFSEQNVQSDEVRMQMLNNRRTTLSSDLAATRERRRTTVGRMGEDGLRARYELYLEELGRVESLTNDTKLQLAAVGEAANQGSAEEWIAALESGLTREELAARDPNLAALAVELTELERQLRILKAQGYGAQHLQVGRLTKQRDQMIEEVRLAEVSARERVTSGLAVGAGTGGGSRDGQPFAGTPVPELQRVAAYAVDRQGEVQTLVLDLAARLDELQRLRETEATLKADLDETVQNIEQFNVQASISAKLRMISEPTTPRLAVNAGKKKQFVVAGAGSGAAAGLGLVLVAGLLDRRVRYREDVETRLGELRMLGMLPTLNDPDSDDLVGDNDQMVWGVQHVRTLLQMEIDTQPQGMMTAVTSAMSGSGKTSLTLALGSSFASTKQRTLLIDFDLVGMGLTRHFDGMGPPPSEVREGDADGVSQNDVDRDRPQAADTRDATEDASAAAGVVDQDLPARPLTERRGLSDVLAGHPLAECVVPTGIPNLSVLKADLRSGEQTGKISTGWVRSLYAQARTMYDVVLVDTGPIPGTVETSVLASHADRVVVVVARGEPLADYERAIGHLGSIGAKVGGVVFNRAEAEDLATSQYSRSTQSRGPSWQSRKPGWQLRRFGPSSPATDSPSPELSPQSWGTGSPSRGAEAQTPTTASPESPGG